MEKEIPESNWVEFLMEFAKNHQGEMVKIYIKSDELSKSLIGEDPLIAFEGDCAGEIVRGVKVIVGEEGEHPDNLFHYIASPRKIRVEENQNGEITRLMIESVEGTETTIERSDR
ncbi:MAG: hypothetical protein BWY68_00529 [bacterium ADurb.Bin400]|nr:MAG: hypothetical protein BWY68_00529 [bacterium ADurb.Bin400]